MKRRSFLKQTGVTAAALAVPAGETLRARKQSKTRNEKPNYTSRVPKYSFADTFDEQEAQLKTNPLILRFKESRKKWPAIPTDRSSLCQSGEVLFFRLDTCREGPSNRDVSRDDGWQYGRRIQRPPALKLGENYRRRRL